MARRLVVVLALALCGCRCGFDSSKLDQLDCSTDDDCAPDQDCLDGSCMRRPCTSAGDCGSGYEFRCDEGLCHASSCELACATGFACDEGWCRAEGGDGGGVDGGATDAGREDGGLADGGREDAGLEDAGLEDAGVEDAGVEDASLEDGGPDDAGLEDAGADGGGVDGGAADGGGQDSGAEDGGPPDAGGCPETEGCDDGDLCTSGDVCQDGSCEGMPYVCVDSDGLACTDHFCDGLGGCTTQLRADACLIDGVCQRVGEPRPDNGCEECRPDIDQSHWTRDDGNEPPDGIACTRDGCAGGQPVHTPDDALCQNGRACALCAGGCALLPSVKVDCPGPPTRPGEGATCTIDLGAGGAGQASCLTCSSVVGMTTLIRDTFEGCPTLQEAGWDVMGAGNDAEPSCPAEAQLGPDPDRGEDQLQFENADLTFDKTVDTRDFDSVRLCFDYADRSMGLDDSLEIYLDTGGGFGFMPIWWDWGGPGEGDRTWVTECVDLDQMDPDAADNASLGIRFDLSVDGLGSRTFLDNIVVEAWDSTYVTVDVPVFSDDFTDCDLGQWIEGGPDPVICPVTFGANMGRDALEAENATWTINRITDLSDRCDDIRFDFRHATREAASEDRTTIFYDLGLGPVAAWANYRASGPEDSFSDFEVNLSHLDPGVRFLGDLDLLVTQDAGGGMLLIDDLSLSGATCESGDALFEIGAPADVGGGGYEILVSSPLQSTAHLECTWDGRPATRGRGSVAFGN